jgi:hypothetical protein
MLRLMAIGWAILVGWAAVSFVSYMMENSANLFAAYEVVS